MEDKRRFTRIIFSTPAQLQVNGELYKTELVDLSLKGALVKNIDNFAQQNGEHCSLFFSLEDSEITIEMVGHLAHIEPNTIGIMCEKIDIESVSHLKRLIELNVGSEELLHRDLDNLSHP